MVKHFVWFVSLGWATHITLIWDGFIIDNETLIWQQTGLYFVFSFFGLIIFKMLISLVLIHYILYIHGSWYLEHYDFDFLGRDTFLRLNSLTNRVNFEFEKVVYILHINLSKRLNQFLYQLCMVECPQRYLKGFYVSLDATASIVFPRYLKEATLSFR